MAWGNRMEGPSVEPMAPPAPDHSPASDDIGFTSDDFRREINRIKRKRVGIVVGVLAIVLVLVLGVGVGLLGLPGSLRTVSGNDMSPALEQGQTVLTQKVDAPETGSIVFYRDDAGTNVGRVVAAAGQWISVTNEGAVGVSDESPTGGAPAASLADGGAIIATHQVEEGHCFVMADADSSALEALYDTGNYVAYDDVECRATFRVWPLSAFGPVS